MRSFTRAGRVAVLATLALVPRLAFAQEFTAGPLTVTHPWARATPGGAAIGGGYLTVINRGSLSDRLLGGSLQTSTGFELHTMSMDGGVMRMRPSGPVDIPAGGSVTLSPSSLHIMFTGLKRGLSQGETVPGTLVFEHAGTMPVLFHVEGIGAKAPGQDTRGRPGPSMPGMDMH